MKDEMVVKFLRELVLGITQHPLHKAREKRIRTGHYGPQLRGCNLGGGRAGRRSSYHCIQIQIISKM